MPAIIRETSGYPATRLLFLKENDSKEAYKETDSSDIEDFKGEKLYCTNCRQLITSEEMVTRIGGEHSHFKANPAGIVYDIRCFRSTTGTKGVGEFEEFFTWFPGFHWQILVCSCCDQHLGWTYRSNNRQFFGIIRSKISS